MTLNTLHESFKCLVSYLLIQPKLTTNAKGPDHSIAGTAVLQTTLEDADNTQFIDRDKSVDKIEAGH